ncbi:hypothetical protein B9P84_26980 [Citrobacter braakii]|nr:hypothetical protein CFA70_27125 [Citrobacter freundii]OXU08815.1 hypothetical protein B9P84_26980 [Citrobacter braakii]OYQ91226.1 hypothetical protein B9P86_28035 [Citrobacter freundii]
MSIFREEALEHNSDTEYGDIVLPASFGMSVCAVATLLIFLGNDSKLLIVFYVQIMPDDFIMQLHRF